MEYWLLHVANILYLWSYSVRDILWLRVITVIAMLLLGGYYFATNQFAPVCWQTAFLVINIFHIGLLIYERRPIQLTDQERKLHEQCLKTLNLRQVRRLVRHWEWQNGEAGAVLLAEGVPNDGLRILVSGEANVTVGGRQIARLHSCQFFGEMSFLTRNVTTAAVIATAPVRYAVIRDTLLQELSRRDPDFATALQAAIGTDLVHKLLKERI
ncbi:MAG TPA: hypothetical protein DCF63_13830 [Planctomycetaceae bacterium]|nr:hypothetical protein [Planctomycetaceae bacterium]